MMTTQQQLPATMRSLVAPRYTDPSGYEVVDVPLPTLTGPDDVLVRVHAAAIQTGDTQLAAGQARIFTPSQKFPIPLAVSGAGTVASVGSSVTSLREGDEVYGLQFKHGVFPPPSPGFASDYVVVPADVLLRKPSHLSFEQAAALSATVVTLYQCMKRYFELAGEDPSESISSPSALKGKTVFIPAALSAHGSVAVQIVKNILGATRVISTVSTAKLEMVEELLPKGVVDEVIDYQTTPDIVAKIGKGKVDFVLNTQWDMKKYLPLLKTDGTGVVVSIASVPSVETVKRMVGGDEGLKRVRFGFLMVWVAVLAGIWYRFLLRGTGVKMDFVSGSSGYREDLVGAGEWVARLGGDGNGKDSDKKESDKKGSDGKEEKRKGIETVVMTVVEMGDLEAVRRECGKVASGKGGLGKLVVKLV